MRTVGVILAVMMVARGGAPRDYDTYGGWRQIRFKADGYFRVAERDGTWWLVTPLGNAFLSKGVNHISYTADRAPSLGYSPYGRATAARYGSQEKWAEATADRLRRWGFNTIGAWSGRAMWEQEIPYTVILNLGVRAGADWRKGTMPDFFSAAFRDTIRSICRKRCSPRRDDPYLLGYFTDNELAWATDWRRKKSLLESYLEMPEPSSGRRAAENLLAERGRTVESISRADEDAFLALAAQEYFRVCHEAIRAADPNHLVLGCRFAGYAPPPVLRAMKGRVDVVSFNNYDRQPPKMRLARIHEITSAPVMITEFSFKAEDSGLPNTKGAGRPVATQQDRADGFGRYVTALAALPFCVGFHWFEYCDEPKEGRFDGENSNYGLVCITDEPWEILTERMTAVNVRMEPLHARKPD